MSLVELEKTHGVSTDYLLCLTESQNHLNTKLTKLHKVMIWWKIWHLQKFTYK
ncbi:hypothetical protein C819_00795 [Lachnospiraceae bacterium 10-1]|nr:hypothetical protein C819_00795 [Lachnospiraceae bacterium 10-1]